MINFDYLLFRCYFGRYRLRLFRRIGMRIGTRNITLYIFIYKAFHFRGVWPLWRQTSPTCIILSVGSSIVSLIRSSKSLFLSLIYTQTKWKPSLKKSEFSNSKFQNFSLSSHWSTAKRRLWQWLLRLSKRLSKFQSPIILSLPFKTHSFWPFSSIQIPIWVYLFSLWNRISQMLIRLSEIV